MKKVLSFVLVLSLVLGSFSMAFAATPTDVVGKDCETAVQALSDLGVVSGYTDGTYKPENPVNRAEACKLIISALGLDAYAAGITATSFTDLDGYGWAVGYIGYAERLGLVKGVGNGQFNPGGPVTYEQWATMLVRALGYTDEVLPGAWPANYMIKAQSLGIMKNIKAAGNAAANRGDVAIMLYNDLDQAIGTIDKDGVFQPNRGKWDDAAQAYLADTMLSRLEKASTADFEVFTDADLANVADGINLRAYLGANVKMYLNDDGDFIGVKDCNTKFLTGDWDGKDTFSVGDTDYTVKKLDKNVHEFLNGKQTSAATALNTIAKEDNVTFVAKVSGKTLTEVFSVMRWNATAAERFEDGDLNTAKCKLIGKEFEEDNNGNIDVTSFELLGAASLDKIAEDNIVEVFTDGKYIRRVTVGTATVEGDITKVNAAADKFTIDGKSYEVATIFFGDELKLAEGGKGYLNYEGKLSDWEATTGVADNYAILLGANSETKYGDTTESVKLFTKEGKEVIFELDSDLDLNAVVTGAGLVNNDLVKYGLNSKGEIDSLTVPSVDNGTDLGKANKKGTTIGGKAVADNVVVFLYDGDDWSLGAIKDFDTDVAVGTQVVAGAGYYADIDGKKIAAIALRDNITGTDYLYGVIDSISSKVNDSNEKYWAIDGFANGAELSKFTDTKTTSKTLLQMQGLGFDQTTTAAGLVQIELSGDDAVGVVVVTNPIADEIEMVATFGGLGAEVTKVNRSKNEITVTNGGVENVFTLDAKAVVYKWDNDEEEWTMTDITGLSQEDMVKFYQTDDDNLDGYNIVLAWDK